MKKKEILTTESIVKIVLRDNYFARNSDNVLLFKVIEYINPAAINLPFYEIMGRWKELNLPAFETVRRTRQKLQMEFPELRADERVAEQRELNEQVFEKYARGELYGGRMV